MVDYVVAKENTGVYHNRRSVHMPVDVELQQRNTERFVLLIFFHFCKKDNQIIFEKYFSKIISDLSPDSNTSTDLGEFLVKSYAKQIKERNSSTGEFKLILKH